MGTQPAIVILGAGILGCALAWRLAERGIRAGREILVVDPNPVASQASARAAALLSLARPPAKAHWVPLVRRTLAAIEELAAIGFPAPLRRCGAVHLAATARTAIILEQYQQSAIDMGVACERVAPRELLRELGWLDLARFDDALWLPEEGYTDGYSLACAYAAAARRLGVRFAHGAAASLCGDARGVAVEFDGRTLAPEAVWVAAGAWSDALLRRVGTCAAQAPVRSQYWITGPTPLVSPAMPIVSVPDLRMYARAELGAILFGLRELEGVALASGALPADLAGVAFDPADADGHRTLEAFADPLAALAPGLLHAGLRGYVCGPSCYTPDGDALVGEVPDRPGLHLLSGCNGAGVALSAGLADLAADSIAGLRALPERYRPQRFGTVDTNAAAWMRACVASRAGKSGG